VTASEELARHVLDQCQAAGLREVVLCAGSRNSPLVLEALRRDSLQTWSFFEERSAAFFALGRQRVLAAESGQAIAQVAVITTSGSAVVELFPALVEAHYLSVPLFLITADRPQRYRGTGAPQAIEQQGIFGSYVGEFWDVEDARFQLTAPLDRSAHINVCLDEPLLSDSQEVAGERPALPQLATSTESPSTSGEPVELSPNLLVMLGALDPGHRAEVRDFLQQLQAPILADVTSGLREAPELQPWVLKGGEKVLKSWKPDTVLRVGGVPSCRFWRDLENLASIRVINCLDGGFYGLARPTEQVMQLDKLQVPDKPNTEILEADALAVKRLEALLERYPQSEPALVRALSVAIPNGSSLFLGNSLPIREWNLAASYQHRGHRPWANRGANGIDGNLSTFLGIAAHEPDAWGVFGDLTTLYDLSAPWILRHLPPGKRFVVINNAGGRIFSRLPVLGSLNENMKQTTENTHLLEFEAWAEMWGLVHFPVEGPIPAPPAGENAVLEIRPDPVQSEAFWKELPSIYLNS